MRVLTWLVAAAAAALPVVHAQSRADIADRVRKLTRASAWRQVATIPVAFPTHHPQGMVKIGDTLFVSSVEITGARPALPAARAAATTATPARASATCSRSTWRATSSPISTLGEGDDLSPGRHRLRRQAHLGAGGRVPAEQPLDRLPRRSGDHEGDRGVPLRRPHRRRSSTTPTTTRCTA